MEMDADTDNGKKTLDDVAVLELREDYKDSIKHTPTHRGISSNWPKTGRSSRRDKGMARGLRKNSARYKIKEAWDSGIRTSKEISELLGVKVENVRTELRRFHNSGMIEGYQAQVRKSIYPATPLQATAITNDVAYSPVVCEATLKSIYVVECPCCKATIRVKGLKE